MRNLALAGVASAGLAACATPQLAVQAPIARSGPPPSTQGGPAPRGTMKPYQVNGVWYTPRADPDYDETGLASWYGDAFHDHATADGEIFDMDRPTAAHRTLPLPSIVEVTNLDNGRSIRVRLNDRGPFVGGRIIDLSRQAAKELGFYGKGLARVRVRYVGPAPALATPETGLRYANAPLSPPPAAPALQPVGAPVAAWRIQAAAFSDPDNAERARQRLTAEGEATVEPLERGGTRLYRVIVRCSTGQDAGALRDRVAAAGFPDARVLSGF